MKGFSISRFILFAALIACLGGCGIQLKESYIINPDLSGKCMVEAKMMVDTNSQDVKYIKQDTMYGIEAPVPNYHKMKFSRRDAMTLALRMLNAGGVEVWGNVHFGMSKKRDMIFFRGTAYFRNIARVHFSTFDSLLRVSKDAMGNVVFTINQKPMAVNPKMMSDDALDKKANDYKKRAFYIRPVLADVLNPTEETVMYQLPGKIVSSSVYGQQGDQVVQLTLTGNDVLRYADSVCRSTDLEKAHYKATGGTNKGGIIDLFDKMIFGTAEPMQVVFTKGGDNAFDYNTEVQKALVYFDDFMQHSGLQHYDSNQMMKDEKAEMKAAKENGVLVVNKADSETHKPYFNSLIVSQSGDTLNFEGELSADVKANAQAKVHVMKIIVGTDQDITDSVQTKNKIDAALSSSKGETTDKVSKREVKFSIVVNFPPGCKEVAVQGRVSTNISDKQGPQLAFRVKQIEIEPVKKK